MSFFRVFMLFVVAGFMPVRADIISCKIKKNRQLVVSFFRATDTLMRQKCVTKATIIKKISEQSPQKSRGEIVTTKKTVKIPLVSSIQTTPASTPQCSGSGGTVKANGRIFHFDARALCEKYGLIGKGSIKAGVSRRVKLAKVDARFRKKIAGFINKTAKKYGMEPAFVHAVISAESAYKPNAKSHAGAMGIMQLMPLTVKRFGVANAYNPYQNIEAGTKYLKLLYDEFGTLELAAASYNAGEGSVRKYQRSIPPYSETRAYVPKVMAYYRKYKKNRALISMGRID